MWLSAAISFFSGFCWFPDTSGELRKTKVGQFEARKLVATRKRKISKGKVFRADRKKSFFCYNYWWSNISYYVYSTIFVITKIHIFLLLFYFSFFIDNAKPTGLDCVNSNFYSSIFSLWKLHRTFCFMNLMFCMHLILKKIVLMKYKNLFEFWFDKSQRYVIFTHA